MIEKESPFIDHEVIIMNKEQEILKIVPLPRMRVVSFHVTNSKTPETEAWKLLEAWAKPKGLFDNPSIHQVYGFNNPDPTKENKGIYGYEYWISIGDEFEVDPDQTIKTSNGGLYAVMSCRGMETITPTWGELVKKVKNSNYKLVNTHQWLEHHVDPHNTDHESFTLDLYAPIAE